MKALDFWYEFASPYSYLSAMRIEQTAIHYGVHVNWRPFLLGPIFRELGYNDSPFNVQPLKRAYMWQDIKRLTRAQGLPFKQPSPFPGNGLLAARIALFGMERDWGIAFSKKVYEAHFGEAKSLSDTDTLAAILSDITDEDVNEILHGAQSPDNKEKLKNQTQIARDLGLFGAPSFTCDQELFWGNDRLEAALEFAKKKT